MVVDYSKWDKLELSDDSDIEVHPNVDKNSFIRWKQRDIHEKREQQKFRVLQLEVNIETNEDLLSRVHKLVEAAEGGRKIGLDVESDVKLSQEGETKTKPLKATSPEQPLYTDMIESMLLQVVGEGGDTLEKLKEHEQMITHALSAERKELAEIEAERKQHITADDIKTGWDSTIVYKSNDSKKAPETKEPEAKAPETKAGEKEVSVETLNSPSTRAQPKVSEDGLEELLPETAKFGEIPASSLDKAFNYLMAHKYIVTEGQKDALLMSAFEHELAGKPEVARNVVWNALLLQYCSMLGPDGVPLFFSKIVKADHPARVGFDQDVENTYKHISSRCKVLAAEREEEAQEETIQLHAVDPDTELVISVPEVGAEGREQYDRFSPEIKQAIESGELDEINRVLASLSVEDAETLVGELSSSGVLRVDAKVYEQDEWAEKQKELAGVPEAAEAPVSSVDEVD